MEDLRTTTFTGEAAVKRKPGRALAQRFSGHFFGFSPLILCALLIWPFGGGGREVQMVAGNQTPAARGTVKVDKGKNGNRTLDIKVHALALPGALRPPENAYVVWLQQDGRQPENLGQIQLNKKEDGELHVKTAFSRFKLFITAEPNPADHTPQGAQVLSAEVPAS